MKKIQEDILRGCDLNLYLYGPARFIPIPWIICRSYSIRVWMACQPSLRDTTRPSPRHGRQGVGLPASGPNHRPLVMPGLEVQS
jgi:hypothetical protein